MKKAAVNSIVIFIVFVIVELIKGEKLSFADCLVSIIIIGVVMGGIEWLWKVYNKRN